MTTFVLRVWLPDRPGALGAVASRVGAVRGDVVGIEIIDRGAGRAVDELTIDLPDPELIDLLVTEIHNVDGVDVEDVRTQGGPHEDLAVLAMEVAAAVATSEAGGPRATAMVDAACRLLHADWAAVADLGSDTLVAGTGENLPTAGWVCGFVRGSTAEGTPRDLDHLAVAAVAETEWVLVVSRDHLPLRGRERALLDGIGSLG